MPSKNYMKGYKKENKIVNDFKKKGCLAFRSAGSHSCVDVVVINSKTKTIKLIQSKSDKWTDRQKEKLEKEHIDLNGIFNVEFVVM